MQRYPTELTEAEWTLLAPLIPAAKLGGRPRSTDMREVVNAILYSLRSGCQWRLLPKEESVSHVLGLSEGLSKLIPIDAQPNHQIVHLFRLGKTDRAAH